MALVRGSIISEPSTKLFLWIMEGCHTHEVGVFMFACQSKPGLRQYDLI